MKAKKILIAAIVLLLLCSTVYLFITKDQLKDKLRENYKVTIDSIQRNAEGLLIKNRDLSYRVDSSEKQVAYFKKNRIELKGDWVMKKEEAKRYCDTLIINQLDSIHVKSEANCDSVINGQDNVIVDLKQICKNDSLIISDKNSVIDIQSDVILDNEKSLKKSKRKILLLKITTCSALVLAVIALI